MIDNSTINPEVFGPWGQQFLTQAASRQQLPFLKAAESAESIRQSLGPALHPNLPTRQPGDSYQPTYTDAHSEQQRALRNLRQASCPAR